MMFQTRLLLLAAALLGPPAPALARPKHKDSVAKKAAPPLPEARVGRSSSSGGGEYAGALPQPSSYKLQHYQHAYPYPLVLSPQYGAAPAAKQPKKPVYHATPLQPYGALLEQALAQAAQAEQAGHEAEGAATPLADATSAQYAADYHAAYQAALKEAGHAAATVVAAPDHKYAAVAHKPATSSSYRDEDKHDEYAAKYQFGYQVRDPKHGSYFGHAEARDGHVTKGHYHVLLPDGRLQNVQYYADPSGFHAQVSYKGVAKHATPARAPLGLELSLEHAHAHAHAHAA